MFKHWVYWKYQYNKYLFNFIDHLHFYSCEWLCRYGPTALLCQGVFNAVKTALRSSYVDEVPFEWPNSTCRRLFSSVICNASSIWRAAKFCIFANQSVKFADAIKPLDNWTNISRRLEVYVIWMWIDWYRKYQPTEPEYEVCWRVSEANELIFFNINHIHIQMTCLSSFNQT
jgi:hypothetical protein